MIHKGELPVVRMGERNSPMRVDVCDLDNWIDRHKEIA